MAGTTFTDLLYGSAPPPVDPAAAPPPVYEEPAPPPVQEAPPPPQSSGTTFTDLLSGSAPPPPQGPPQNFVPGSTYRPPSAEPLPAAPAPQEAPPPASWKVGPVDPQSFEGMNPVERAVRERTPAELQGFIPDVTGFQEQNGWQDKAGYLISGLNAPSDYGTRRTVQRGIDLVNTGDPDTQLGEISPQGIAQHPENILDILPQLTSNLPGGGQDEFNAWLIAHPEVATEAERTGDLLGAYNTWLEETGQTLETGQIPGMLKGMGRQAGQDVSILPTTVGSVGAGAAANAARLAGKEGLARGILVANDVAQTAIDPIGAAAEVGGKRAIGMLRPSKETEGVIASDIAREAVGANLIERRASGTGAMTPNPQLAQAPVAPPAGPVAPTPQPVTPGLPMGPIAAPAGPPMTVAPNLAPIATPQPVTQALPVGNALSMPPGTLLPPAQGAPNMTPNAANLPGQRVIEPTPPWTPSRNVGPPQRPTRAPRGTSANGGGSPFTNGRPLEPNRVTPNGSPNGTGGVAPIMRDPARGWVKATGDAITDKDLRIAYRHLESVDPDDMVEFPMGNAVVPNTSHRNAQYLAAMTEKKWALDDWPSGRKGDMGKEAAGKRWTDLFGKRITQFQEREVNRLLKTFDDELRWDTSPGARVPAHRRFASYWDNRARSIIEAANKAGYDGSFEIRTPKQTHTYVGKNADAPKVMTEMVPPVWTGNVMEDGTEAVMQTSLHFGRASERNDVVNRLMDMMDNANAFGDDEVSKQFIDRLKRSGAWSEKKSSPIKANDSPSEVAAKQARNVAYDRYQAFRAMHEAKHGPSVPATPSLQAGKATPLISQPGRRVDNGFGLEVMGGEADVDLARSLQDGFRAHLDKMGLGHVRLTFDDYLTYRDGAGDLQQAPAFGQFKGRGDDMELAISYTMDEVVREAQQSFGPDGLKILAETGELENSVKRALYQTLNHESLHAFRSSGVIKDSEWKALVTEARKRGYHDWALETYGPDPKTGRSVYEYDNTFDALTRGNDQFDEEAVAEMFGDFALNKAQLSPKTRNVFQRMVDVVKGLLDVVVRNDGERVMNDLLSGKIGSRTPSVSPVNPWSGNTRYLQKGAELAPATRRSPEPKGNYDPTPFQRAFANAEEVDGGIGMRGWVSLKGTFDDVIDSENFAHIRHRAKQQPGFDAWLQGARDGQSSQLQPVHRIPLDPSQAKILGGQPSVRASNVQALQEIPNAITRTDMPVAYKRGNTYIIADGHHRVASGRLNGEESVPAFVWDVDAGRPLGSMPSPGTMFQRKKFSRTALGAMDTTPDEIDTHFLGRLLTDPQKAVLRSTMLWKGTDQSLFSVSNEIADEADYLRFLAQRNQTHGLSGQMQQDFDRLSKQFEKYEPRFDWSDPKMPDSEVDRIASDYFIDEWQKAKLPNMTPAKKAGMGQAVKQLNSDINSLRRTTGMSNIIGMPRQVLVQTLGNMTGFAISKPKAITGMFKPGEYVKAFRSGQTDEVLSPARQFLRDFGFPDNAQIDTGTKTLAKNATSIQNPVLKKVSDVFAPKWSRNLVATPDDVARNSIFRSAMIPGMKREQAALPKRGVEVWKAYDAKWKGQMPAIAPQEIEKTIQTTLKANTKRLDPFSRATGADIEKAIMTDFGSRAGAGTPQYKRLQDFANRVGRDWNSARNTNLQLATKEVQRVAFTWDNTKLDDFVANFALYHYWVSRATGLYAKEMIKNPWKAATLARMGEELYNDADRNNYPEWLKGMTRLTNSPAGTVLLTSPTDLFGTWLMFADWQFSNDPLAMKEDRGWFGNMQGIVPLFFGPVVQYGAYLTRSMGQEARPPGSLTGLEGMFSKAAQTINLANLNGDLPFGMLRDGDGQPILIDEQAITRAAQKFAVNFTGMPEIDLDAGYNVNRNFFLQDVLREDHPEWANDPNGENNLTRLVNEHEQRAKMGDYSDEWLEAERRTLDMQLTGPDYPGMPEQLKYVLRLVSPLRTTALPENRTMSAYGFGNTERETVPNPENPNQQMAVAPPLGTNDLYDSKDKKNRPYDTLDMALLNAANEDYLDFGSDSGIKDAASTYSAIGNGNIATNFKIGDFTYTPQQLSLMSDGEKWDIAEKYLNSKGFTREDYDQYKADRDAIKEANPDLQGFLAYKNYVENYAQGPQAFVDQAVRTSPSFARFMSNLPYAPGTEDYYKAALWTDAYYAIEGRQGSVYDPITNMPDRGTIPGMAYGQTFAQNAALQEVVDAAAASSSGGGDGSSFDDFVADVDKKVTNFYYAKQLLDEQYPGAGYMPGNLDYGVYKHMEKVWEANNIDPPQKNDIAIEYYEWLKANATAPEHDVRAFLNDRERTGGSSGELVAPTSEQIAAQLEISLVESNQPQLTPNGKIDTSKMQKATPAMPVEMRTGPSLGNPVNVQALPPGLPLYVADIDGDWAEVVAPGGAVGWVPTAYLKTAA